MAESDQKLAAVGLTQKEYESLTDETITEDQILDLKEIGCESPPQVEKKKWAKRVSERSFTPIQTKIFHLSVMGTTPGAIAEKLDISQRYVNHFLNREAVKLRVRHKQELIFQDDAKASFKTLFNKAYGTLEELLANESGEVKDSIRLETAKYVIDHVAGKANQTIQHNVNILTDIMRALDQEKDVTPKVIKEIEATPIEPEYVEKATDSIEVEETTEKAKTELGRIRDIDDMEALADLLVPNEFVVGRRGENTDET